jgi:hypothetical protein
MWSKWAAGYTTTQTAHNARKRERERASRTFVSKQDEIKARREGETSEIPRRVYVMCKITKVSRAKKIP